jgi:putative hydrolase of the HAD superfamily
MLKTVYFDLGNVLFFFSHPKMFSQLSECTGLPLETVKEILVDRQIQEAYEMGKIDSEELYRYFKARSAKQFSLHELIHAVSDIFTPNKALWPTVERLKKEGIRLVVISNTCECHYNRVYSHYPILRLFDHKVLSFEVGTLKPDPRIFQKALQHAECAPEECFYTDDVSAFVASARKAGLDSELFTDVPTLRDHLVRRGCDFLTSN